MEDQDDQPTATDNRRRAPRRESEAAIKVSLETGSLAGRAENLSAAGVFFFSADNVRVRVEIEDGGKTTVRSGRLVRVESISDDSSGFAIEFDRA
ncbi:MAG: PilZ domain-containing protein [Planctomycetes bacterium]|nr:PilZ domain-containing protein [Planctomycetota bacterium]